MLELGSLCDRNKDHSLNSELLTDTLAIGLGMLLLLHLFSIVKYTSTYARI